MHAVSIEARGRECLANLAGSTVPEKQNMDSSSSGMERLRRFILVEASRIEGKEMCQTQK